MEIVAVTSTSVNLRWMPPEYPNGVIIKYSISSNGRFIDDFGGKVSDKMSGEIKKLLPDTVYVFELKAYTIIGSGLSASITVKTRKLNNDVH